MRIKSKTKKIALWSIVVTVAVVAVCVTPMIVNLKNVFAYQIVVGKERPAGKPQDRPGTEWVKVDDEQECVQYSGAANVESVKEAVVYVLILTKAIVRGVRFGLTAHPQSETPML